MLALQGDFEAHGRLLRELGAEPREVRVPRDLEGLDGLVMPGGESTTMTLGIEREGLADPLREFVRQRQAGARHLRGDDHARPRAPRAGRLHVPRNAFGRQIRSFEADLRIPGIDGPPVRAVFIRAPWIADAGEGVEILASVDGHPVAARQDNMLVISFHPEIAGERRVHELFLEPQRAGAQRLSREFFFVRHGESVANVFDRGARAPEGDVDRLYRARLGAGARARAAAARRGHRGDRREPDAPRAGDRGGDQRGARAAARAPTTSCSRSRQSDAFYANRPTRGRARDARVDADRAATSPRRARSRSPRSSGA